MVSTAAHAAALVQRVKYPLPAGALGLSGQRGSAFSSRAAGYGNFGGPAHTQRSNDGIALVVMIETPEGVTNAESIAAVGVLMVSSSAPTTWRTAWAARTAGMRRWCRRRLSAR